jgi:hypothetical protein
MPGKKLFVLAAVSAALAVAPVGAAVAALERPTGSQPDGWIAVVTGLTPLDGESFEENALVEGRPLTAPHIATPR